MACVNPKGAWLNIDTKVLFDEKTEQLDINNLKQDKSSVIYKSKFKVSFIDYRNYGTDSYRRVQDTYVKLANEGKIQNYVQLGCGKCRGCKKKKANDWYVRCLHESYSHSKSCVATLTYNESSLASRYLQYSDIQRFLKRLRKYSETKIRYFVAGEYGKNYSRPHWHIIIFGWRPDDMVVHERKRKHTLYRSHTLAKIWGNGFVTLDYLTPKSIDYCVKYIQKGALEELKYDEYGVELTPLYHMSTAGGLGKETLGKYIFEIMRDKVVKVGKFAYGIPKFYLKKIKEANEDWYYAWLEQVRLLPKMLATELNSLAAHYERKAVLNL